MSTRRIGLVFLAALAGDAVAALPQQMQAAAIDRGGNAAVITLHTLPVPKPAADEVLIALHTAGVASWDVGCAIFDSIKNSRMPLVPAPTGPAWSQHSAQVHGFKIGDEVTPTAGMFPQGGFYAEYVAVPAAGRPVPRDSRHAGRRDCRPHLTRCRWMTPAYQPGETLLPRSRRRCRRSWCSSPPRRARAGDGRRRGRNRLVKDLGADVVVDGRHGDVAAAAHARPRGAGRRARTAPARRWSTASTREEKRPRRLTAPYRSRALAPA
jgi:hypothetical protein